MSLLRNMVLGPAAFVGLGFLGCDGPTAKVAPVSGSVVIHDSESARSGVREGLIVGGNDTADAQEKNINLTAQEQKDLGLTTEEYRELVDLENRSNLLSPRDEDQLQFYKTKQGLGSLTDEDQRACDKLENGKQLTREQQLFLALYNDMTSLTLEEESQLDKLRTKQQLTPEEATRLYTLSERVAENLFQHELKITPNHVSEAMLDKMDPYQTVHRPGTWSKYTELKPGTSLIHSYYNAKVCQSPRT